MILTKRMLIKTNSAFIYNNSTIMSTTSKMIRRRNPPERTRQTEAYVLTRTEKKYIFRIHLYPFGKSSISECYGIVGIFMPLQALLRGFWRRWILVILLCLIGIGFIIFITKRRVSSFHSLQFEKFVWLDLNNLTHLKRCRNSVQGPHLIVDETGHVCRFTEVLGNGCCNPKGNSTERFLCTTCQLNRCCRIFEHCIACCLQPQKRKILEKVLMNAQQSKSPLLRSVQDTFELCLHKCRTSSTSVLRENRYRDSLYKYCYGVDAPVVKSSPHRTTFLK